MSLPGVLPRRIASHSRWPATSLHTPQPIAIRESLALLLYPFILDAASKVWQQLGLGHQRRQVRRSGYAPGEYRTTPPMGSYQAPAPSLANSAPSSPARKRTQSRECKISKKKTLRSLLNQPPRRRRNPRPMAPQSGCRQRRRSRRFRLRNRAPRSKSPFSLNRFSKPHLHRFSLSPSQTRPHRRGRQSP